MLALDCKTELGRMPRRRRKRRHWRPETRGDCPLTRPCPYVGCKYHLLLHVAGDGALEIAGSKGTTGRKPAIEPTPIEEAMFIEAAVDRLTELPESCALDVADRRCVLRPSEVAKLMGYTKRRISQIEVALRDRLRAAGQDAGDVGQWLEMALQNGVIEWPS
jgi:hypothetical protein